MTFRSLSDTDLKRLHRSWRQRTETRLTLLLDNVKGPYNVGSIMRTAAAMRVEAIHAIGLDFSWTDKNVQKTAMGTHRFLELKRYEDAASALAVVKNEGHKLVGLELATDATPAWDLDMATDTCIVIGHEDHGVSPAVMNQCDGVAYIPLLGRVGSLNAATAASIACYEARRQQLTYINSTDE